MDSEGKPGAEKIFSGRSENYSRYRPSYPSGLIPLLEKETGLSPMTVIADIGSGTGILSKLFIENGNVVHAVEPSDEMRTVSSTNLRAYPNFHAVKGTGENTPLADNSVDLVTCGQSFHWFKPDLAKIEFRRILRERGSVALIWNDRVQVECGFNHEYERICKEFSPNYHRSGSTVLEEQSFANFFEGPYSELELDNFQKLTVDGIMGRYQSASYAIGPDNQNYPMLQEAILEAFRKYQENGFVKMKYVTRVYLGKV